MGVAPRRTGSEVDVEAVDRLVLPWHLGAQVDAVEDVLHRDGPNVGEEDHVLEGPEGQLGFPSPDLFRLTSEANMIMTVGPSKRIDSTAKRMRRVSRVQRMDSRPSILAWANRVTCADCSILQQRNEISLAHE